MKKTLLTFILVVSTFTCFSQNFNIPDPNFEQALIDLNLDNTSPTDEIDGVMSLSIAADVTNLNISNRNISDLSGIENFTSLERLFAENNNLSTANFSSNLALERLTIYNNNLSALDLSNHSLLERLYCQSNQITSLMLPTSNSSLQRLECQFNNLTAIDLSTSILLDDIKMQHNNFSIIDFSSNTLLKDIDAFNNQLSSINLDNCDLLEDINFRNNQLTSLVLEDRPELLKINLEFNNLSSLTVKNVKSSAWNFYITLLNNPNLTCVAVSDPTESENEWTAVDSQIFFSLDCNTSTITILDPNFEQALIDLNIDSDGVVNGQMLMGDALGITDLNVNSENISDLTGIEFFTDLETLIAYNNNLTAVNLNQNTQLTSIILAINNLTEIDLSNNPNLISVSLNQNNINTIDLSNNTAIVQLFLNQNNLTEIDVTGLSNLENLGLSENAIVELDVSQNQNLVTLFCNDNNLTSLRVNNSNNTNFTNFEAQNNSDLFCIDVDDITFSNSNWLNAEPQFNFDSQSLFGLDCAPSNDDCSEAQELTLGDLITGTTISATSSDTLPECGEDTIVLIDVWYTFTAPNSGAVTAFASSVLGDLNANLAVYNNCNEAQPISCDAGTIAITNLTPGETYFIQVWIGGNPANRSTQNASLAGDFTITVEDTSTLSLSNPELYKELKIFPNPATHKITIESNSNFNNISIYSITGKRVFVINNLITKNYSINLQDFAKGVYLLKIKNERSNVTKKIVIK